MFLQLPRRARLDPGHPRMLRHPAVEYLLAGVGEGVAATTAYPAQLKAQVVAEQTAECASKRRALRVPEIVRPQSLLELRPAGDAPVARRGLRCDADVQQQMLGHSMAALDMNPRRRHIEIERIHSWSRRCGAGAARDL